MSAACPVCQGSGETIRGSGIYDCQAADCNAAVERTALEEETPFDGPVHPADALWIGYQAGKAAALEQAANDLMRTAVSLIRECTTGLENADDEEETYLNGRASGIGHLHTELLKLFPKA